MLHPRAVVVRFSVARPDAVLADEGAPLVGLVREALDASGLVASEGASLVLAVNAPGAVAAPSSEQPHRDVETLDRELERFVRELAADARAGRRIALADVAYSGGKERALEALLDACSLGGALELHAAGPSAREALGQAARALGRLAPVTEGAGGQVDREIAEQPRVLERLLARPGWDDLAARVAARAPEGVLTVARGSSDHAASYFGYFVWTHLELPAASFPPSVATLHGKRPRARGRVAIGISQSGESPDVVRGLEALRSGGAYALALTNGAGSALARAADETVELGCGPEKAVAATKTFTASLAALLALGARWAKRADLVAALERIPEAAARALEVDVSPLVEPLAGSSGAYVLGRGPTLALAEEVALKLKEVARVRAEALSTSEFVHGPLGSLEPGLPVVVVLPSREPLRPGCVEVAESLREKGARVLLVGESPGRASGPSLEVGLDLPDELAAIPQAVALQRLAVAVARARGLDPDRPRNLEKVTRTW